MMLGRASCLAVVTALGCGGPPVPRSPAAEPVAEPEAAPASFPADPLASAETIEIEDTWSRLLCHHTFKAVLHRRGEAFVGEATLELASIPLDEPTRVVEVPRASIVLLQMEAVANRGMGSFGAHGPGWTDDYPSGSMTFIGPTGRHRLAFTDQRRVLTWEYGGETVTLDSAAIHMVQMSSLWHAYTAVLEAMGMPAWATDTCFPDP